MVWGVSGSGKSKLVETWADGLREKAGRTLVGWAKFDRELTRFCRLE